MEAVVRSECRRGARCTANNRVAEEFCPERTADRAVIARQRRDRAPATHPNRPRPGIPVSVSVAGGGLAGYASRCRGDVIFRSVPTIPAKPLARLLTTPITTLL